MFRKENHFLETTYFDSNPIFFEGGSDIFYDPHRKQLREEGKTRNQNYYYQLEYANPGKYSLKITALNGNKSYNMSLKGCID